MGIIITLLMIIIGFKILGLIFKIFGKLLGCVFGLIGYIIIGVLAVAVFGIALAFLPLIVGAGIAGIVMLCTKLT